MRELAQAPIDRDRGERRCTPLLFDIAPHAPVPAEQRDDVRVVAGGAVQVHHQRRLAVDPQRAPRDERRLDAVRAPLRQHARAPRAASRRPVS